jgi:hypothetical protein
MNQTKNEIKLNRNGNRRGMHPNSQNNIKNNTKHPGRPRKEFSITNIQREMLDQLCPYAEDPTWTWAKAIAMAGLRESLTDERARENLKDRIEGKVTQPIGGENGAPLAVKIIVASEHDKQNVEQVLHGTRT